MPTREDAWTLLCEYTASESLRKHMLAVEACVRAYARKSGADEEAWGLAALLHDFDYERWPNQEHAAEQGHPSEGAKILREMGYSEEIVRAIISHADKTNSSPRACRARTCARAPRNLACRWKSTSPSASALCGSTPTHWGCADLSDGARLALRFMKTGSQNQRWAYNTSAAPNNMLAITKVTTAAVNHLEVSAARK